MHLRRKTKELISRRERDRWRQRERERARAEWKIELWPHGVVFSSNHVLLFELSSD